MEIVTVATKTDPTRITSSAICKRLQSHDCRVYMYVIITYLNVKT